LRNFTIVVSALVKPLRVVVGSVYITTYYTTINHAMKNIWLEKCF